MKIIISPAKKMTSDTDSLAFAGLPVFIERTERILDELKRMDSAALKRMWKCNDSIAQLNEARIRDMDLRRCLTPAILAYEGIQYRYMAPGVFTGAAYDYIQEHLRILSGFYGLLRPFDGVVPYRLEMQAALSVDGAKDLYEFWGSAPAELLQDGDDCIINLASKEYSLCVSRHLMPGTRFISCVFGEEVNGRVLEKGTLCKMARGEMVRFMAENRIETPDELRSFSGLGYSYSPEHSGPDTLVFLGGHK